MARVTFALALIILAISAVRTYRVRAADEAATFVPLDTKYVFLSAPTVIHAVLTHKMAESAVAGETVTAFVSAPVVFDGRRVIPPGAQLKGNLEKLLVFGPTARATIRFTVLLIEGRAATIYTRPVVVMTPVQSDTEILSNALKMLWGASLGAAIGAESGNPRALSFAVLGAAGASASDEIAVPVTVVLIKDLKVCISGRTS